MIIASKRIFVIVEIYMVIPITYITTITILPYVNFGRETIKLLLKFTKLVSKSFLKI